MKNRHFHRKRNRVATAQNRGFTVSHFTHFRRIGRIFGVLSVLGLCLPACTACEAEVHWFGRSVMVPWYVIAVPSAAILLISHLCFLRSRFVCPKCQTIIRPRWYEISVWLHCGDRRVVKCPRCGRRGFCTRDR